jgi:Pyridoxamine 5'-phosphate oxidase
MAATISQHAQLSRAECLRLLGSVPFGRAVFTSGALPAVRLASHLVGGGHIAIRASLGEAVSPAADGAGPIVAYEADQVDTVGWSGWSVVVVGRATLVADEELAARYRECLNPTRTDEEADQVITISLELVTGHLLHPDAPGVS